MGSDGVEGKCEPLLGMPAMMVTFSAALLLAVTQGVRRYGWRLLVLYFVIAFVISNFWEDLSIATGFPFGNYHYTVGPKLIDVPIMIGIIYFGLGYITWMTANVLLDKADEHLDLRTRAGRLNVIALPVLAGAVMTMYDVASDSSASTVARSWIWEDGGGLFGVPWTNHVGWWFVTWSFFQVFALVLTVRQTRSGAPQVRPARFSAAQPVLIYLSLGLAAITAFVGPLAAAGTVTDPTGAVWDNPALFESLMIIALFTIIPTALLALTKIARGDLDTPHVVTPVQTESEGARDVVDAA